ncbi:MAG: helix-turn-helix domain-containing protein [Roseitalea sp.]|nr:helix-turn-helix domain-containing protein [Roseitalea sp.]MBO6951000.1 helix-turn-helix domain-containing protein [Rhizobiaceae bacterium]MBO6591013.1 helix-turn-helix domain-containing protein [Roseitalea sp.]MBO6599729.1 helix-turn-helix domain-containing protein [Roseitalea sp.]MBO6611485.1 helix-turn-helix domain-containing protein [Roseitalea sp.]
MTAERDQSFDYLPATLADIATVIGLENAIAIARAKGGTRVWIPTKVSDGHWLARLVGMNAAMALCSYYAVDGIGVSLDIPLTTFSSYKRAEAERAKAIRALLDEGKTASEIARIVGVDRRTVFAHKAAIKSGRVDGRQGTLF